MTERSKPRTILAPIAIMCVTLLTLAAVLLSWSTMGEQSHVIDELSVNNDALRAQVKSAGETPVAPPAEAVTGSQVAPVPGPTGVTGATGPRGERGDIGLPGQIGPQGEPGADGKNGADGRPGVDGAPGSPGAQGPAGSTGAQGPPGPDGQPPVSWTYTDALGLSFTCTRPAPFDPAAPTYQCAPTPGEIP